mmetsp:Transcript_109520/g.235833  ORF Transcript_109520/g.235833 Transcript_109520/m.235833 type:complete len:91 (-) Transcript_109520:557-829(-)
MDTNWQECGKIIFGKSKMNILQAIYDQDLKTFFEKGGARKTLNSNNSICSTFDKQLKQLTKNLENTNQNYIRCLKPNKQKMPDFWDGSDV